jgi:butyrate kinase
MIKGRGGVVAYLGTNNIFDVEKRIEEGDKKAKLVFDAMCYQIAKEIGAYSVVLSGNIDRIILTGGVANDKNLVEKITSMVSFIAPVEVFPGEEEMQPLALGVLRVLKGEEKAKKY